MPELNSGDSGDARIFAKGKCGGLRLGVLGSGRGSNFQAIASAIQKGRLHAEIRVVISDVENAGILALARACEVPGVFVAPGVFRTKLEPWAEEKLVGVLQEYGVEIVVLAGWMRLVKAPLLAAFPRRILNIHPSLLPKYPGLHAWEQAVLAGEKETGCTVHYVDAGMDTGEIIAQSRVPIFPGETPEVVHARIQAAEHLLYPDVLAKFTADRVRKPES